MPAAKLQPAINGLMLLRFILAVMALLVTAWLTGLVLRRLRRRY